MIKVVNKCISIDGRTLIVVPKIENTFYLEKLLKDEFPNIDIGVVNSKSENNEYVKNNSRIIISTIRSLGVGADIRKLRNLIIAEPHSSKIISNQLIGRLREYSPTEDTYVYELVDSGFPQLGRMITHRYSEITRKCKTVKYCRL
jgi:superfamily II DNA or RNA helicase